MMGCKHDNCFTCPYDDCIDLEGPVNREKGKPGRKKLPPEVKAQNEKRWQQDYYQRNKEKYRAYQKKYYAEHAKMVRQRERARRIASCTNPESLVWITKDGENKRIRLKEFPKWEVKGWERGRTVLPYKLAE